MILNIGDVFAPGEVWQTPKGTLWKAIEYDESTGEKRILLRAGLNGSGRKQYRPWDKTDRWRIWIHSDGKPAASGLLSEQKE